MRTTTAGHVMLGMLRIGSRSGYEIRRAAQLSLRAFWAVSPPQIYRELTALEEAGLVVSSEDPRGNRPRRLHRLTEAGEAELRAWLREPDVGDLEIRDLAQVKLLFADALPPDEQATLVEAMRQRSRDCLRRLAQEVVPAAERTRERHHLALPTRIAGLHVELHEFLLDWCDRLEAEITRPRL